MNAFVDKYEDHIHGVLSCLDRMLFHGYPLSQSGAAAAEGPAPPAAA